MKTDPSMNVVTKQQVSVTQSNHFDRIMENPSFDQSVDDESRDIVPNSDVFSPTGKEAKKNRERFAITKSYSIEVSSSSGNLVLSCNESEESVFSDFYSYYVK